jgi:hypothetical protein
VPRKSQREALENEGLMESRLHSRKKTIKADTDIEALLHSQTPSSSADYNCRTDCPMQYPEVSLHSSGLFSKKGWQKLQLTDNIVWKG